jgi:hypothetical protein
MSHSVLVYTCDISDQSNISLGPALVLSHMSHMSHLRRSQ